LTGDLKGGCACGAVRYQLASAPMFVHCCHCRDCQRQTGSAFVLNALIEAERVTLLSGNLEPIAVPTDSGRPHEIYRCPCPCRKLNPDIMMMQSAQDWSWKDAANSLDRARERRILVER